ncbi:DUF6660 family protein [Pelobium manganitolerans]|uniref:DUF6660 family protein n=1 Tax=Pelobium manganitolerans TaxID=1842495 RepID=UPI00374439F5
MKFTASILTIVILAMHFLPCSDAFALNKSSRYESVQQSADNEDTHKAFDECTPFCSCACCAIPSVTQAQIAIKLHVPDYSNTYRPHTPGNFIDVSLPIWQPPQLIS